ncbi:thioredoxin domain-containing protein [Candidatus Roizmanbacteria bacterium]|nr:thioredoxin domain-containing protein [Candidatus Roizmanbacteria bacterium]
MPRSNKTQALPSFPIQEPAFQASPKTNNMVYILLVILTLFSVYLFFKVRNLEQKITGGITGTTQGQQTSLLSVDNLKKYAKESALDTGKFNKCLDSGEKKSLVDADENYGSSVGVQGTPGFFVNGRLLAGAFPFEFFKEVIDKELAGKGSNNCGDYSQTLQKYCQDGQNKPFDPVQKKIELGNSPSEGASNPKVVLVEFSDFQCPYCIRAYPTVKKILETYKNDVRLYYKQFPLINIHPFAEKAAEASLCVLDQGGNDKFWKFHNKLFDLQSQ